MGAFSGVTAGKTWPQKKKKEKESSRILKKYKKKHRYNISWQKSRCTFPWPHGRLYVDWISSRRRLTIIPAIKHLAEGPYLINWIIIFQSCCTRVDTDWLPHMGPEAITRMDPSNCPLIDLGSSESGQNQYGSADILRTLSGNYGRLQGPDFGQKPLLAQDLWHRCHSDR